MHRNAAIPLALVVWFATSQAACAQSSSSWVRLSAGGVRDNQTRTAFEGSGEYGWYFSPSVTLAASTAWQHAANGDATSTFTPAVRMTFALPALHTGIEASGGALLGAPGGGTEPAFGGVLRVAPFHGVAMRAEMQRDRYTTTLASLDTLLMRNRYEIAIDRAGANRWAFVIAARQERFGDGNPIDTAFGWLLAPLSASVQHRVRLGYAFAKQDAEQSRWVPDDARRGRGGNAPDTIPGRYDPYYSPHDVVVHSALLEGVIAVGAAWLTLNTSIGVHAKETAPVLVRTAPVPAAPQLAFFERSFHPSQTSALLTVPLSDVASVRIEAWHDRTAFYRATGARIGWSRQFGGR